MFLHWESNNHVSDIGIVKTKPCPSCAQPQPWKLLLRYRYSRIWYFISWVSHKHYVLVCSGCGVGVRLASNEAESKLERNPISIQKRLGWMLLSLLVALLAGVLVYMDNKPADYPAVPYHQVLKQKVDRSD